MSWEVVIGLETHAQLSTVSKIFSGASTSFGAAPNTQATAIDIALPGVLPSLNKGSVERAIKFGLAVNGTINTRSVFARKNYFYPDLPKGYQISQYEIPVVQGGMIRILSPTRGEIDIALTRAHLEEDAGKSLHEGLDSHDALGHGGMTGIDLNRAGTPLLEIVSEPELRSAEEAIAYAKALHRLVRWIGICDGNMQEGSFRCDANVSVRPLGETRLGTRCEIKNLNSFRFMQQAIEYEVRRQIELIEDGGSVVQETRLYDPERGETRSMRSKEDAQDYRYFPDPDLPPLVIDEDWIAALKAAMSELPEAMKRRLGSQYALSPYDAAALTCSREMGAFFEDTCRVFGGDPKVVANWLLGELSAALNSDDLDIADAPLKPADVGELLRKIADGSINAKQAKQLFSTLWEQRRQHHGASASISGEFPAPTFIIRVGDLIQSMGLHQISDESTIEKIVADVLTANPAIAAEYKSGKEKAFNALVGKAMAASKGKANPAQVNAILRKKLNELP